MGHYRSNLRDIEFNLFELLGRDEILGTGPFAEADPETARGILAEVERLAAGPVAESFAAADRHPPEFDPATHEVRMPAGFKASFQAFMDAEWYRLELPEELGGTTVPRSLNWSVAELILGANPAVWMYASGASFSRALFHLGTPEQREFALHAAERRWTATMALTEPDAGSDVGAGRTKAIAQPDGTWHIEGVKRTSSTWCWPGPRGTARAPRDCPCSWSPSTCRARTARPASGTASTSPGSSTRWA